MQLARIGMQHFSRNTFWCTCVWGAQWEWKTQVPSWCGLSYFAEQYGKRWYTWRAFCCRQALCQDVRPVDDICTKFLCVRDHCYNNVWILTILCYSIANLCKKQLQLFSSQLFPKEAVFFSIARVWVCSSVLMCIKFWESDFWHDRRCYRHWRCGAARDHSELSKNHHTLARSLSITPRPASYRDNARHTMHIASATLLSNRPYVSLVKHWAKHYWHLRNIAVCSTFKIYI